MTQDVLMQLLDERDIAHLLVRYTDALDRKDWQQLQSCFADEPVFVHPGGRLDGFPAILARTSAALEPLESTQHLLGNVVVEVEQDTATATSFFQAQHVRTGTPGGDTYLIGGRYTDRLVRTAGGWRIVERVQEYLWRDGNRAVVAR